MNKPQSKKPKPATKQPAEPSERYQLAEPELPFSFRQFFAFVLALFDIFYMYVLASSNWQAWVVQGNHGRVYFVLMTFLLIAVFQLVFIGAYYAAVFLTRFHRR